MSGTILFVQGKVVLAGTCYERHGERFVVRGIDRRRCKVIVRRQGKLEEVDPGTIVRWIRDSTRVVE